MDTFTLEVLRVTAQFNSPDLERKREQQALFAMRARKEFARFRALCHRNPSDTEVVRIVRNNARLMAAHEGG